MKKQHHSDNKYIKHKPVLLNGWTDFYTLGIFCQKVNLVEYAKKNLKGQLQQPVKKRLFEHGIADADEYGFEDIAYDIAVTRDLTEERFDQCILNNAGLRTYKVMKEALKEATDWETAEIKKGGKVIIDSLCKTVKTSSTQQATVFGEDYEYVGSVAQ